MAVRLFPLRNVPDDEADDVRELLTDHQIEFYETFGGNWGVSMPAIWLRDNSQLQDAKALIAEYQTERTQQQRAIYKQLKNEGKHRTFWDMLQEEPLKIIAYISIVFAILYFSTKPFLSLGE
ncbi:MAG: hypothetical protein COB30_002220 [Ectothiorhodospiraceae bacterium]|nr:hypothetical protein [Ectothiorhodospiraceae bacterium]